MDNSILINSIMTALSKDFDAEQLQKIEYVLISKLAGYRIEKECTDLSTCTSKYVQWGKEYLVAEKLRGRADGTIKNYQLRIEDFLRNLTKPLELYTDKDIMMYLYRYEARKPNTSLSTIDHIRRVISGFLKWCVAEQYLSCDITYNLKKIKYTPAERKPVSDDDIVRMKEACETTREKLIVALLYESGVRVSELTGIRVSDINFNFSSIDIIGKGGKRRTVFFSHESLFYIRKYIQERGEDGNPYLIAPISEKYHHGEIKPIGGQSIRSSLDLIAKRAGIDGKVTPHRLRHSFATDYIARGGNVVNLQKLLGHSKMDTTMIYTEISTDELREDYKKRIV